MAYASGFREAYDLFMEARHKTEDAVESTDNREELREQALGKFREATAAHSALKHHEAVIHVEGPREVTAAVIQAGGKLQKFRSAILDALGQAYDEDTSTSVDSLDAKAADAHDGYVNFLHAASDALNADLLALED
ncbi:hypothetical protein ABZW02_24535 [Streptomyces sp. NPDC005180]|uniref:hypothetical protein n=1 Tax=Streptomyces sp. NPDC005180 TaxID=3156868 RepID=UPI0033A13D7D